MPSFIFHSKLVKLPQPRERLRCGRDRRKRKLKLAEWCAEWAAQVWEGPSVNQQEPRDGDLGLPHWRP